MLDERIDDVARQLTVAAPPRDLRARVLLRIEEGNRARMQPALWRLAPVAVTIAVIVILALRLGWHSRVTPASTGPLTVAGQHGTPRTTLTAPPVATAVGPTGRGIASPPAARTMRGTHSPQEQTPDFIERLTIVPIAVDGVQVGGIATPEAIEPRALEMSSLSVSPLGTEERPPD